MGPAKALALRTFADARTRMIWFMLLFGGFAGANVIGYRNSYPTVRERLEFAQSFGANKAARLFYGTPYHLDTIGGYATWRFGGLIALFAAFFGILAAVRAFRGEEESGRQEVVAAGAITRRSSFLARILAIAGTIAALWAAATIGLVAGSLPTGSSAYLALAAVTPAAVYAGAGAAAAQLMPSSRRAMELAGGLFALDFVLRVVSDTTDTQGLHWLMPLGWVEELRPFADQRPAVLLLPLAATAAFLLAALWLDWRRDVGLGILAPHDVASARLGLLGSPALLAVRLEAASVAIWLAATGAFAFIIGTVSKSVASGISASLKQHLEKLGIGNVSTPSGYIGLTFLFFVLAIGLFCCAQLGAVRADEAEGRLETLFALPRARVSWLAGRLGLAVLGAGLLAMAAGLGAALGAVAVGADVSFLRLVEAGFNCLPASMLFLGLGALLVASVPRLGVGAAYAIVAGSFVWELVGSLLGVPSWMLGISPFHQVGLIPAADFKPVPAALMLAIAVAAAGAALVRFRQRDLVGA